MLRRWLTLVAALSLLLFQAPFFVWCHEADGRVALELAASPCCAPCSHALSADSPARETMFPTDPCCDCIDVPVSGGMLLHPVKTPISCCDPVIRMPVLPSPAGNPCARPAAPWEPGSDPPLFLAHCVFLI